MSKDVVAGFGVRKNYAGEKDFDTTYKSIEIKKKLVALGSADPITGEIPYSEEIVEVITETPIKDVIAAQEDSCGLEAYLKPYKAVGMLPPDVEVLKNVQDFTQFDDVGDLRVSGKVDELYNSLPEDLRAKYGSPADLLKDITDSAIREYVESKMKKPEEKKEEKVNE